MTDTPRKGPSGPIWDYPTTQAKKVMTVEADGTVAPEPVSASLVFPVADAGEVLVVQPVTGLATPQPAPAEAATITRTTPEIVPGAGAGGFINLTDEAGAPFVYNAAGLTANQKLEVGIDATTIDETTLAITELRANRSYWLTGGVLTILNDSTVFASGDLRFVISALTLELQGNQAAAAGHTKRFVGSVWVKVVDI